MKPREPVHLTASTLRKFFRDESCSQPHVWEEDAEVKTLPAVSPCCIAQLLPRLFL